MQPVERYIYNHNHYHRAIADLGEKKKYKDSIQKATCKAKFDLANENLVDTFEAGRAYESELLCVSALVSRLPEEIRHKFDDIALGDLTVPKIADKFFRQNLRLDFPHGGKSQKFHLSRS